MKNIKRGFTLIELIVVIAIIGVLVLLATPKFMNYISEARGANILNDIKVLENKVDEYLIKNDDTFPNDWTSLSDDTILVEAKDQNKLYSLKGLVDNVPVGTFKEISNSFINTKLKGKFYINEKDAVVYYVDIKLEEEKLKDTIGFKFNENTLTITGYDGTVPTDLVIPAQIIKEGVVYEVKNIGPYAFYGKELNSVIIPEGITIIQSNAFAYTNITSVTLPNSITTIQTEAFAYNKLTSITLPDNLNIGSQALADNKLTSITIGSGLTIGNDLLEWSMPSNNKLRTSYQTNGAGTYIGTQTGNWTKQ